MLRLNVTERRLDELMTQNTGDLCYVAGLSGLMAFIRVHRVTLCFQCEPLSWSLFRTD